MPFEISRRHVCKRALGGALVACLMLTAGKASAISPREFNALVNRISQMNQAGQYREGLSLVEREVALTRRMFGSRSNNYAAALDTKGTFLAHLGRYEEAAKALEEAIRVTAAAVGPDSIDVAMSSLNLANVYGNLDEFPKAIEAAQRGIAIFERAGPSYNLQLVSALNSVGGIYEAQAKYPQAEATFARAVNIAEKLPGPNGQAMLSFPLTNLGMVYREEGRFDAAVDTTKQALAATEKAFGPDHPEVADTLLDLAKIYDDEGVYDKADDALARAMTIYRAHFSDSHPSIVKTLVNEATNDEQECRVGEAENLYKQAIAAAEQNPKSNLQGLPLALNDLADIYIDQGHLDEAEGLKQRALDLTKAALGANHPSVARPIEGLAMIARLRGNAPEALSYLQQARKLAPNDLAWILREEAIIAESQGHFDEAINDDRQALATDEKTFGTDNPRLISDLRGLGLLLAKHGHIAEGVEQLQRALAISRTKLGPKHPTTGYILGNLGFVATLAKKWPEALDDFRQETALSGRTPCGALDPLRADSGDRRFSGGFRSLVPAAWHVAATDPTQSVALEHEAFTAAQNAQVSQAAAALAQMAVRFASGKGAMAHAVREEQDLKVRLAGLDKKLATELGAPDGRRNEMLIVSLRRKSSEAETELAAVHARIAKDFPQYTEVADPAALSIEAAQGLLRPNEALIAFMSTDDATFVFAVTREASRWRRIELPAVDLTARVKALRKELYNDTPLPNGLPPYDIDAAHQLYSLLFGKIDDLVDKQHEWLIVPEGALTSLPFHVLVTQKPDPSVPLAQRLRKAAWLLRSHATTILPSVSSLRALRRFAHASHAKQPFIGFGDPDMHAREARIEQRLIGKDARPAHRFFRGIDFNVLRNGLPPLPETAGELRAIAHALGASDSDVKLGDAATVTAVESAPLDQYRVVDFATHGLLAGETKGLTEPALVLSLPTTPNTKDDGLLTATDVTSLKLDADWAVLSACNTAAGEKPGAEGLSGLARAFFYAGARALLVSHWPVDSDAAVRLTTKTFAELAAHPQMDRAEALRQSMLALLDDTSSPANADPSVWAPFVLVGDNLRPQQDQAATH